MVQLPLPLPPDAAGGEPEPELDYLTVAQAAQRLHCHERTIRRAVEQRRRYRALEEITPREISMRSLEMQRAGKGPEPIRMSMMFVQAMFTLALEWGEATSPGRRGRPAACDAIEGSAEGSPERRGSSPAIAGSCC
jgi:hypothetical protein